MLPLSSTLDDIAQINSRTEVTPNGRQSGRESDRSDALDSPRALSVDSASEDSVEEEEEVETTGDRYPLRHAWRFWYQAGTGGGGKSGRNKNGGGQEAWEERLSQIGTFETVEEFWRFFNNIKSPSTLGMGESLQVFRDGVKPMWEDPMFRDGSRLCLTLSGENGPFRTDESWKVLLLLLIGGTDSTGALLGLTGSYRKNTFGRIEIWLGTSAMDAVEAIRRTLATIIRGHICPKDSKEVKLELKYFDKKQSIQYSLFQDSPMPYGRR
eukprot:GHVO01049602.1.p1 GENE.GHVO01049602.1~~GHVO01049602.1.p1  ORF type:complete len:275 (-),score=45.10 GHVO01049602.1:1112-1915(-)